MVGPVVTAFWRKDEFGTGEERQLLLTSRADGYAALEAHLLEHHPWKNPEVAAVPLVAGADVYLRWIATTVGPALRE
ncbi:divalent cation tolerance protein CutA [Streptomyces sp. NPDC058989]|uniref:divalent cation tolerance protein CutA n=1 Tax=Streptomyces sp. NPDC058989 TaxID=3346686 RepID=UPI00368A4452